MASIHLIERLNNVRKLVGAPPFLESGYWSIPVETAERLTGGDLYLHSGSSNLRILAAKLLAIAYTKTGQASTVASSSLSRPALRTRAPEQESRPVSGPLLHCNIIGVC